MSSASLASERREVKHLHGLSNGTGANIAESSSKPSLGHSAQNSRWRQAPTVIPTPGTERRALSKATYGSNPYSRITSNNLSSSRGNPSTHSLVVPIDKLTVLKTSKSETTNRRDKLSTGSSRSAPSLSASATQAVDKIFSSPTKSGGKTSSKHKKSTLGDPLSTPYSHPVINVDEEDLGEPIPNPVSESSDDLLLHVGERPGQDSFTTVQEILEVEPPSSMHPFTRREGQPVQYQPPPPGPQTSALKARMNDNPYGRASHSYDSDPIEDDDEWPRHRSPEAVPRKRKATPSGTTDFPVDLVRNRVEELELSVGDDHPLPRVVDLRSKAARKTSAMRPKKTRLVEELGMSRSAKGHRLDRPPPSTRTNRKEADPVATSPTGFRSGEDLMLPIEKWIVGTRMTDSTKDTSSTRHWLSMRNDHVRIMNVPVPGDSKETLELDLMLGRDVWGITFPKSSGTTDEYPYLEFHVRRTQRLRDFFTRHEQDSENLQLHVKFLTEHPKWDLPVYMNMGETLSPYLHSVTSRRYVDSHGRRAIWEDLERNASLIDPPSSDILTTKRQPKPRPAYTGPGIRDPSRDLPEGSLSSSNSFTPGLRRSSRNSSNLSRISVRPPSLPADETILLYPSTGTGAVNVTHSDLKRLEPGEYLNDTLIELGLKLWLNELKISQPELAEQVHVFSSFFYTQLNHKNVEEGYQSVRKWTSKFDLFKKKYIIVPINEHMHWYLAIICYPDRTLHQPNPLQPVLPNVTTRNKLRESLSKSDSHKKPPSQRHALSSPENPKPISTSSKSVTGDEQEVEKIISAYSDAPVRGTLDPPSPLSTIAPDSPRREEGEIIPETESEGEDERIQSEASMDVDGPLRHPAPPTTSGTHCTVSTSKFYADVEMRSVSAEREQQKQDEEIDQLEDDVGMEIEGFPSAPDPMKPEQPYIFSFDSLGARHPHALKLLSRYLDLEARDKKEMYQTTSAITKQASVPTQPNYCDCGVYLLHFVEQFMSQPEKFTRSIADHAKARKSGDINRQEREHLWNHAAVANKRENLKQTIVSLSSEWKRDGKEKGKAEDEPGKAQVESIIIDDDSDIEVLETTLEPRKAVKNARSYTPAPHKAQRIR